MAPRLVRGLRRSPKLDPIGGAEGHVRVIQGGSWIFCANDRRRAERYWRGAYDKSFRIGFRIARTIAAP